MSPTVKKLFLPSQRLRSLIDRVGLREEYFLVLLSILIGLATGAFADLFFRLIEFVRHLAYGEGGLYAGRAWMLIVLPTVGALAVGHITYYLAREAKGHGVPEVLDALYRHGGEIRPRVASAKAVASALTIGSGGSAGTEGPIIQIGAAIGSSIGQFFNLDRRHRGIVVACGVSAGIGAIFNAPIAGVMFALEIFLKDFSFRTFSPVVFSSVVSCSLVHSIRGKDAALFDVSALRGADFVFSGLELPLFLVLGLLCALAAVLFIRGLYFTEDLADRLSVPDALKPAIGAIGLGLAGMCYVWIVKSPNTPEFFGNGYPSIQSMLSPDLLHASVWAVGLLFVLKLFATCLTLGSGGSGGVFAPSLLMGATLGGGFGLTLAGLHVIPESSASAYALVGMAALVAGTTHAPLMAIVMLYEVTREPKLVLPVMFAAIVATAVAQLLLRDSIYTLKLRRRGVRMGAIADLTILRRITVDDVEKQTPPTIRSDAPLQTLLDVAAGTDAVDFAVVDDQGVYQGMITGRDVRSALLQPEAVSLLLVGELLRAGVPTVTRDETLETVLDKFARSDVGSLPVVGSEKGATIEGLITRQAVMRRYHNELDAQTR